MSESSMHMTRPGRLAGKVALITGTGGDQGRVAARRFAEEGAMVVGCDLNADANEATRTALTEQKLDMMSSAPVDLGDPDSVAEWIASVVATYGRIDVLYNNVAAPRFAPVR